MTTRAEVLTNEYNPYENREVKKGQTGSILALINLIKAMLGTGILALPDAIRQAGLLFGTVSIFLISAAITCCLHIMFAEMYFVCKRDKIPQITYPQTMKIALLGGPQCLRKIANCSPYAINFFIILYQFGVCCIYVVFIAKNFKMVIDDNTSVESHLSLTTYMIIFIIPLLLLTYIKNLKMIAPLSNIGNWITLACLITIYYCVLKEIEPLSDRSLFGQPMQYPLFIGTVMYSVLSVGSMLCVEANMKDGSKFLGWFGVLNQSVFIVTILNALTGFFGYWKYGEDTMPSITLNLGRNEIAWSVQTIYSTVLLISYPTHSYPMNEIIWEQYVKDYMETSKHPVFWDYSLRTVCVFGTLIVAIPLPFLGLIISLVGAFCLSVLGIISPPLIDICLRWPDKDFGTKNCVLVRDIILLIFGVIAFVLGTYAPVLGMIKKYEESLKNS